MTNLDVIREAVFVRRSTWATLGRDCSVAIDLLDSFANGRANIQPPHLDYVVDWIWNSHVRYVSETDTLEPVPPKTEPRSLGILPALNLMSLPQFGPPGIYERSYGPQPEAAPKPKPKAGWKVW